MFGSLRRHRWLVAGALLMLLATPTAAVYADDDRPAGNFVPNELLVKINPSADIRALMAAYNLQTPSAADARLEQQPIYHLRIGDGTAPLRKADQLLHDRRVVYAEPNYIGALPETRQRGSWVVGDGVGAYAEPGAVSERGEPRKPHEQVEPYRSDGQDDDDRGGIDGQPQQAHGKRQGDKAKGSREQPAMPREEAPERGHSNLSMRSPSRPRGRTSKTRNIST